MTTKYRKVFNSVPYFDLMQIKLLKNLIDELAGENSGQIADILFEKRDVNEFLIAKKMKLTINQVRNILYKLSAEGLVSFTRKKDKKKGWYIYYWTLNTEKCLIKVEGLLLKKIGEFKFQLNNRESKRFYACKQCNLEVSEESALEHGFVCEECADVYVLADNEGYLNEMKLKISRTEKELRTIQEELIELRAKESKKKASKEKKIKKKEDKEKDKKKKAKKREKKKNEKKEKKHENKKSGQKKKIGAKPKKKK
jgi:transcription factor E